MRPLRRSFVSALVVAAVLIPTGTVSASAAPDRTTARRSSPVPAGRISPTRATFAFDPVGVDFDVSGSLIGLAGGGTGTWRMTGDFVPPQINLGPAPARFRASMSINFSGDRPSFYLVTGTFVNRLMTWSGTGLPSSTAVAVTGFLVVALSRRAW